ncbi:Uncharacterised protein [Aeromonas salmonicida]|nr:hypothetical protein [Aeromonas salmonicida]SPT72504.1 Uncharacterised protein [Aeromonas salmonicida]
MTTLSGRLVVVLRYSSSFFWSYSAWILRGFILGCGGHLDNQLILHGLLLFSGDALTHTGGDQRINALLELTVDDLGRNELGVLAHNEREASARQVGNKLTGCLILVKPGAAD